MMIMMTKILHHPPEMGGDLKDFRHILIVLLHFPKSKNVQLQNVDA